MATLSSLAATWAGDLLRHRPTRSTRSVLDDSYLGQTDTNRWSGRDVRAYYFASDIGVVLAEHARHIAADVPLGHAERLERSVFSVAVSLERVLRLTDPAVVAAMGAAAIETWILDIVRTQAAATYLRTQLPDLQGLVVPSVAFLDDPARYNLVVFRDAIDPFEIFGTPIHVRDITIVSPGA